MTMTAYGPAKEVELPPFYAPLASGDLVRNPDGEQCVVDKVYNNGRKIAVVIQRVYDRGDLT